ncbi:MAG: GNAT family N-acetyltransferase [Anaerolineaceae bacterium]|nr:GNAT family N-acetyltransferase [Anaerolineaceae bacterium]
MLIKKRKQYKKDNFAFRPSTPEDIEALTSLFNDCSEASIGVRDHTPSLMRAEWITPETDLARDTRVVVSLDGKLVAAEKIRYIDSMPVHPAVRGCVHPDYEGLGLGTQLLEWAEARCRQLIEKVPSEDARVSMYTWDISSNANARQLFEDNGMKPIRYSFRMLIEMQELPAIAWPEGFTLRTYNHERDAEAVYRADDETFQDHFGYLKRSFEEGLKDFVHYSVEDEGYDPDLWFLAVDGDQIAGYAICRKWSYEDRETGYVSNFGVRRSWRRRGLGLALLQHAFRNYYQRGLKKVALHMDGKNLTGALRLYERAGMHVHRRYDTYEQELRPGKELSTVSLEGQ